MYNKHHLLHGVVIFQYLKYFPISIKNDMSCGVDFVESMTVSAKDQNGKKTVFIVC